MAQLTLSFGGELEIQEEASFIRDIDCRPDTPVIHGHKPEPIYNKGIRIYPKVPGRRASNHDNKVYLPNLDPLESYSQFAVFFSGGKDSVAAVLNLLELGVPKEKIVLYHHDIDGRSDKIMDWPATKPYTYAFAKALGIRNVRLSYREGGFWGEVYRLGASQPVTFEEANGDFKTVAPMAWERTQELKELMLRAELEDDLELLKKCDEELRTYGYRFKFPAKSADLTTRYCSAALKIEVASVMLAHQLETKEDAKVLIISGERRGESPNRARYNEMELHRTHAPTRKKRIVHHWRCVIDHSERDIWEIIRRARVLVHPVYRSGQWGRASCALCIFSSPSHWAGVRELMPGAFQQVLDAERTLGFTLDNKLPLERFVGDAKSCVDHRDQKAIHQLVTGEIGPEDIILPEGEEWTYPAGAFRGVVGGPC